MLWDVAIIGGGPSGTSAAIYSARAKLKTLLIDKDIRSGALGLASKIVNYPGVIDEITGYELVKIMRNQAEHFGAVIKKNRVTGTDLNKEEKLIYTVDGEIIKARTVIIATGAMGRTTAINGEREFLGRGVSYCATCDGPFFKNRIVAVCGFTEEAVEDAIYLTRFAKSVYYVCQMDKPNADQHLLEELVSNPSIKTIMPARITKIYGDDVVRKIELLTGEEKSEIETDGVFIYGTGNKPVTDFLSNMDITMTEEGCIVVDDEMMSSIPGVFACGDVIVNKVKQAVVACAQGCIAALSADKFLRKSAEFRKDRSVTKLLGEI